MQRLSYNTSKYTRNRQQKFQKRQKTQKALHRLVDEAPLISPSHTL